VKKAKKPYVQMKKVGKRELPHYRLTWWEGGKRRERFIRLPEDMDSAEFDRAYWSIRSGKAEVLQPPVKETWAELVAAYRSHPKFTRLAIGTRRKYDPVLSDIVEKNGQKRAASMTRAQIRAVHAKYVETPRKADYMVQILSLLLNFARLTLDWKIENHAAGIDLYGKQREFEPWPEWMITKLADAPDAVRTAAELILGTGQRPAAAIAMRHDDFTGETMRVIDEKSDMTYEVYCPKPLRAYLTGRAKSGAFILAKNLTEPLGYDAIERAFRAWRKSLGDPAKGFVLHGLRKLAIVRLAEAGCSDAQIQAITNQSPEMVAYYRKGANRKKLSKSAHQMVEQNKDRT
jgi:hypothetical protein